MDTVGSLLEETRVHREDQNEIFDFPAEEELLCVLLDKPRSFLVAHPEYGLSEKQAALYRVQLRRLLAGEPVEYITGWADFYSLRLHVSPATLIPRPETELLVEHALAALSGWESPLIADIGTGSGAIAMAIAHRQQTAYVIATDVSMSALKIAARNMQDYSLSERVDLICCDLLSSIAVKFTVIVANLPYVATDDVLSISAPVVRYEPRLALDGGPDGLTLIEKLLRQAKQKLIPNGALFAEIGYNQGDKAAYIAADIFPNSEVKVLQDLAGLDRILCVRLK